jgi:hypothetical protein
VIKAGGNLNLTLMECFIYQIEQLFGEKSDLIMVLHILCIICILYLRDEHTEQKNIPCFRHVYVVAKKNLSEM